MKNSTKWSASRLTTDDEKERLLMQNEIDREIERKKRTIRQPFSETKQHREMTIKH
jgi:hypothetical protein